jgi:hypothetical protein
MKDKRRTRALGRSKTAGSKMKYVSCAGSLAYPFEKGALMRVLPVLFLGHLSIREVV